MRDLKARMERLERRMANEVQDLQALKAAVDAKNASDAAFQTSVNDDISALDAEIATLKVAGTDTSGIDDAITSLKASVAGFQVLALPADPNTAPPVAATTP
jgi:uncharacterized membrane protein